MESESKQEGVSEILTYTYLFLSENEESDGWILMKQSLIYSMF